MPRQAAGQHGSNPPPSVKFPAGPGVCVAGSSRQDLYRIVQSKSLNDRMAWVQSRTPFPLEVVAWLPGTYAESNRQGSFLRRGFRGRSAGDGWYRLSTDDIARACAYLSGEAEQRRQEAARAKEQAEKEVDDCIRRLRMMAEFARHFSGQERRLIRSTWPQQRRTDEFLQLVDRFCAIAGKFDTALSRRAMEIQLDRMPKDDAGLRA
jgi:hypothetical protein